jgi:hypothetical protein
VTENTLSILETIGTLSEMGFTIARASWWAFSTATSPKATVNFSHNANYGNEMEG